MSSFRVTTGARLHFGLLAHGESVGRRFGGVGLMIDGPGVDLVAEPAHRTTADGPQSDRVCEVAESVRRALIDEGIRCPDVRISIREVPPAHAGLGSGTQIGLAVARAILSLVDPPGFEPDLARLAALAGRGRRSGIGLHGFRQGGLLIDGGRRDERGIPPLLARMEFPAEWSILLVRPAADVGLHGHDESAAFRALPSFPEPLVDRLCRHVLLGILPAVAERDLEAFGAAVEVLQQDVGGLFAPVQGGIYATSESARIVAAMRAAGLCGVGQSSWGPILYGFVDAAKEAVDGIEARLREECDLSIEAVECVSARNRGADVHRL